MSHDLGIEGFHLLCSDVAATAAFYVGALSAVPGLPAGDHRPLTLGYGAITLAPGSRTAPPAASNSTAFQHLAIIVSDMDAAMSRLSGAAGWTPISRAGPERLPENSGGVTAFKFRDPEGHPLEFLAFPPDAFPDVWRGREGVVLGIDHSAITVSDVARSVAFYEGLGFSVGSRQVNRGIEQERMDDVDGAVVDVVALMPPGRGTPHLELLHYRVPGTHAEHVPDDDILATRVQLCRCSAPSSLADPDGHRLAVVDGAREAAISTI